MSRPASSQTAGRADAICPSYGSTFSRECPCRGGAAGPEGTDLSQAAGRPGLHLRLAVLAERLGLVDRALHEYNLSLRDDPAQPEALKRLGRLRADRGETERAVRAHRSLLELAPRDAEALLELGSVLEETGRGDEAGALYSTFFEAGDDGVGEGAPDEIVPTDADLVTFTSLFSGREGVYARQRSSPTGKHGYTPVEEPFTPALACRLVDAAAMRDMTAVVEESGWKGRHVWLFFEIPVPAAAARRLADVFGYRPRRCAGGGARRLG